MIFKVTDIKLINKMVTYANEEDEIELTNLLKRRQIDFYKEIQKIKYDPRCFAAYKFCLLFCSIATEHAERIDQMKFKKIPHELFQGIKSLIAQDKYVLDKRFKKLVSYLEKYILEKQKFDEDDTFWLKINIGAFIILLEKISEDKIDEIEQYFYLL
jgi:hypothetical protein